MVELLYFSSLDLMVKVEYFKKTNSLRYASHREIEHNEKTLTEQYIMGKATPNHSLKLPSSFVYLGIDKRLQKRLARFHQENDLKALLGKDKEITAAVNNLINVSMRNYYAEKIGDVIITARSELKAGWQSESKLASLKLQMSELLRAYNLYAEQKVALNEIIPLELKACWPDLKEARCDKDYSASVAARTQL